jgi:hypothetical protein
VRESCVRVLVCLRVVAGMTWFAEFVDRDRAWPYGICTGFVGYWFVFCLSVVLSPILVGKQYSSLRRSDKVDWHSRVSSSVHAISVAIGCIQPALFSELHLSDRVKHYDKRLWLEDGSLGPEFYMAIFVGFLSADTITMLVEPEMGSPMFFVHHIFAGTAWSWSMGVSACQWYGCFWLLAEFSTLFVNVRYHLSKCNVGGTVYLVNGLLMLTTFFIVRVSHLPFNIWRFFTQVVVFL